MRSNPPKATPAWRGSSHHDCREGGTKWNFCWRPCLPPAAGLYGFGRLAVHRDGSHGVHRDVGVHQRCLGWMAALRHAKSRLPSRLHQPPLHSHGLGNTPGTTKSPCPNCTCTAHRSQCIAHNRIVGIDRMLRFQCNASCADKVGTTRICIH